MFDVQKIAFTFKKWLNQPKKVFVTCAVIFILALFLNGTVWKVWGLYRDESFITEQIQQTRASIVQIESFMKQAKDPTFIERQARDKMDLVGENDLVFVFPE